MKKITFLLINNIISKQILAVLLLFGTTSVFAQTITDVYPTRVTTSSVVTIKGAGFSIPPPTISVDGITIDEVKYLSSSEITFRVTNTSHVTYTDGHEDTSKDITGVLSVSGSSTGYTINYIAPRRKTNGSGGVTRVTEVYTNWDHDNDGDAFWSSEWFNNSDINTFPNDSHDLLGFVFDGDVYSTGVDDALLSANISGVIPQTFKAYSTNGVIGNTHDDNFLAMADLLDNKVGASQETRFDPVTTDETAIYGQTVFDVIIDGVNGLDLGTGITNFNQDVSIRFYSGNGQFGAVDDDIPDLLVTQIADSGNADVYYYADENGEVIGRPIKLDLNNGSNNMFRWRLDLYDFIDGTDYNLATPQTRYFNSNEIRYMKVLALELKDFEIISNSAAANYNTHGIGNVNNINMAAGGTADMAFIAYNKASFDIKSPVVTRTPVPRYICRLPSDKDILFSVDGELDGTPTVGLEDEEELRYQWYKYNDLISGADSKNYTVNNGNQIDTTHTGAYKVRIYNDFGTAVLPVTLTEGGVPTTWDSSNNNWNLPPVYSGITVEDEDRSLIFSNDYSRAVDLEGCDCFVPAGRTVTIPSGSKLKLYNNIVVEAAVPSSTEVPGGIPAGTFTLENNASLVQVNELDGIINNGDVNEGDIKMKRVADNLKDLDYVYWSSPVEGFNVSEIPNSGKIYEWNPTVLNPNNTSGNWVNASGEIMKEGKGYIVRVPSSGADFTNTFTGVPNNGTISVTVEKSNSSALPPPGNQNFNLIGNPYPSAINAVKFLAANINIEGSVHLWTHEGGFTYADEGDQFYENLSYNYEDSYLVVNALDATPSSPSFDGNIASGQAFFVKRLNSAAVDSVEFTNAMRYDSSEDGYDNDEFFRGTQDESLEKQLIWLSLVNEKRQSKSMLLGYAEGATYEKDRLYDAQADGDDFRIYSLISDEKMVIQGRPLPFSDADEVPLGIQVAANGSYQIGIDNLKGSLFENEGQDIYLEDTYLNMEHDLRQSPYSFTAVAGSSNDRFMLKYVASSTLSVGEDVSTKTYVYINDATLHVKTTKNLKTIQVFDFSGKRIENYRVINNANNFSSSFPFSNGGYIVKITLEDGSVINKKLIN